MDKQFPFRNWLHRHPTFREWLIALSLILFAASLVMAGTR